MCYLACLQLYNVISRAVELIGGKYFDNSPRH